MNNKIANIIVDYIKDLTWIDKIAGITQVARINQAAGETTVEKRFPISCDLSYEDACGTGCYDDLAPSSKKKSVVYFEDQSFNLSRVEGNKLYYESRLRLIAWLNYKLIEGGCGSSGDYVIDIIKTLPAVPTNIGDLLGVNIQITSQLPRSADIFGKYTYNEPVTQYMMLPYDFFALDIRTSFWIISECIEPNPGGCEECS